MPTLPIWKVTSVRKMLIKCSSKFFPVSSASLPVLFCFLLPAGIGKHLAIYKPFLISPFAYQIDLEWTKCEWESGSPGEFLREATWVLSSKWSPTSVFCAPVEGSVSLKCNEGKTLICCNGRLSVFGQISVLERAGIWWFTFCTVWAQPHRNLDKVCGWLSPPTMSLV